MMRIFSFMIVWMREYYDLPEDVEFDYRPFPGMEAFHPARRNATVTENEEVRNEGCNTCRRLRDPHQRGEPFKAKAHGEIGERPILWHIMKHYSQYGFHEFVICLGYKQYVVKEFLQTISFTPQM